NKKVYLEIFLISSEIYLKNRENFLKMSNSDTENTDKDDNKSINTKFEIKSIEELKELKSENLFSYIDNIHRLFKKQDKKIKKYKNRINKLITENFDLKSLRNKSDCETGLPQENIPTDSESKSKPVKCAAENQSERKKNKALSSAFIFHGLNCRNLL
ncbi:hypothetical protein DOY81_015439, partial [Sarcophaga bullata]